MFLVFVGVMYVAAVFYLLIAYCGEKPPVQPHVQPQVQPHVLERRMF